MNHLHTEFYSYYYKMSKDFIIQIPDKDTKIWKNLPFLKLTDTRKR